MLNERRWQLPGSLRLPLYPSPQPILPLSLFFPSAYSSPQPILPLSLFFPSIHSSPSIHPSPQPILPLSPSFPSAYPYPQPILLPLNPSFPSTYPSPQSIIPLDPSFPSIHHSPQLILPRPTFQLSHPAHEQNLTFSSPCSHLPSFVIRNTKPEPSRAVKQSANRRTAPLRRPACNSRILSHAVLPCYIGWGTGGGWFTISCMHSFEMIQWMEQREVLMIGSESAPGIKGFLGPLCQ
ncbi:hypothetical protein K432DRAFT_10468 [Lepidopterella palustris CBS 459.81]|uniref:Uncharacterized protein n=1 Tax=Lepidopterella palustris CBS 459.81 TaxID=1314670 RepID=A0A8E2ED92_9PEZI|nr:hypothetical protein K432DRAFT_10468 [Lepidopterella palustris CBS 459.81]